LKPRIALAVFALAALVGLVRPALAAVDELLLCLPGFPGTPAQAQPYIDKMLRHLEQKLGKPSGSISGVYLSDGVEADKAIKAKRPSVALVGPSILAANHKALGMKVIARVEVSGRSQEVFSIVAKKGGVSSVAGLAGKKVSGIVVNDEKFVVNVLLEKKVKMGSMTLVPQKRPLKSLRDVARGEADAAVVDQSVVDSMKDLPEAADLVVIFTAKAVPAPAVVVMGEGVADAAALSKALVGMCGRPDGAELCKTLTLTAINAATDKDYKDLLDRYGR
jgi:ABC-type phosphate/phosphonate transport system substrate-binding protein